MNLAERLEKCYSGAVFDALREMGRADCVLPHEIKPLDETSRLAGKVFTVGGHCDETLDEHETLLRWTELLSKAPSDSVVICQPNNRTMAHMGELSAETFQLRGVRGYIVDGGCRDSDFISRIGFRVFCRYFTPKDIVGQWAADNFGGPISIGDVTIHCGDYVLADRDGVVIIPGDLAEKVAARTENILQTENLVRKAILQGVDPQEAFLKYGKF